MDHGDRRSGAHGAAARSWRGGGVASGAGGPPPPKVYRVEPRDFRELVQRLTGASAPASAAAPGPPAFAPQQRVTPAMVVDSRRAQAAAAVPVPGAGATEPFDYASWFSAPLLSPAYGAPGFSGGHHQQQGSSGPLL